MTMRFPIRATLAVALAGTLLATSGCGWFRKGDRLYAGDVANRPLEVPPDLDLPRGATSAPAMASAVRPGAPAAGSTSGTPVGFTIPGSRDAVFARVGTALESIDGVTVTSRSQVVGAFDVGYAGSNFLVRVSDTEAGAYISAVDPRGVAAAGDAPARLMDALQAALTR